MARISRLVLHLSAAVVLLSAGPVWAAPGGDDGVDELADEFYWSWQRRLLRPVLSKRGNAAWLRKLADFETRLGRISRRGMTEQQRITRQMLERELSWQRRYLTEGHVLRDMGSVDSLLLTIYSSVSAVQPESVNDWRWIIRTLGHSGTFVPQYIELLKQGLSGGTVAPADVVRSSLATLDVLTSDDPKKSAFVALEGELARTMKGKPQYAELRRQLRAAVKTAVTQHARLASFLRTDYLPRAPRTLAAKEHYRFQLERHLAGSYQPEQLAALGRRELAEIHREMERVAKQIKPDAKSLSSFFSGLTRRASSSFSSPDELLQSAREEIAIARKMAERMAPIPRASSVEVKPVPAAEDAVVEAQYASTGELSGEVQLNTGRLFGATSRYELANLMTHEAYGGHHLQALHAQRQDQLPAYRRDSSLTVFDEGWAMYAEHWRHSQPDGYSPHETIGHLLQQAWAAAMLVVDVGLHTSTMSKSEARRFMGRATFSSPEAMSSEVERMIDWPGQGLTYYVGRRELLATRREVERVLGRHFDERRFHTKLLSLGSVPPRAARAAMLGWARRRLGQLRRRE